jgi:hypothetical protein
MQLVVPLCLALPNQKVDVSSKFAALDQQLRVAQSRGQPPRHVPPPPHMQHLTSTVPRAVPLLLLRLLPCILLPCCAVPAEQDEDQ